MSDIRLPLQHRAATLGNSFNESTYEVEVIWSSGAPVRRRGWDGDYIETLSMAPSSIRLGRLNGGSAPVLNTHSSYSLADVVGAVVAGSARIANGLGLATIKLSNAPEDAGLVAKIKSGVVRNISVGYQLHKVEKTEPRDGSLPVWNATDWEPLECSIVPIGADPAAQIRSMGGERVFACRLLDVGGPAALALARMTRAAHRVLGDR